MASLLSVPLNFIGTCFGTCTSYCACKALTSSCSLSHTISRFVYLGYLFGCIMLSSILQHYGSSIEIHIERYGLHYDRILCDHQCMGSDAVYRISIALFCFFIFMSLLTSTISSFSTNVQTKYWGLKTSLLIGCILTTPTLPDMFITHYITFSKYTSMIFLMIQMTLMIDFGYVLNDRLVAYDGILWKSAILTISTGVYVATVILVCTYYTNVGYGVCILLGNVGMTTLSLSPIAPHGTLLTSSFVSFQIAYMYLIGYKAESFQTFFGTFLTAMSLTFNAYSTSKTNVFHIDKVQETNEMVLLDSKIIMLDEENQVMEPKEKQKDKIVSGMYHITLALCSTYYPLVLIGLQSSADFGFIIGMQVFCAILYVWTLIAPHFFPNRDFN